MLQNITENVTDGLNSTKADADSAGVRTIVPLVVIGVIIVIENALVCLAFATNPKLRKRQSNILVCSQAVIDFLVGGVFIPWVEVEEYKNQDLHSGYMIYYVLIVSLGNLLCLAADRYLALIKPLKHHMLMNVSKTKRILLVTWLTPLFLTMIPLAWHKASGETQNLATNIYLGITCAVMLLTCILMISMYIRIYITAARTIRLRQKRIQSHPSQSDNKIKTRKELRIAHLFGLLLLFFILAYLPLLYLNLIYLLKDTIKDYKNYLPKSIGEIIIYSLAMNSVVNPILCLLLKKDYQLIIKRWICLEWMLDQRRDENQRSQTYCRTRISEFDLNGAGSEEKKRLFGIRTSRMFRRNSSPKPQTTVHFSCKDDMIALMANMPHSEKRKGRECEINKNNIQPPHDYNAACLSSPTLS